MPLIFRTLDPSEYAKIPPEATGGRTLPESGCKVVAALDGEEVVAIWCAIAVVHMEPIWVHPDHRSSPTIIRRLWARLIDVLKEAGVKMTMTIISSEVPASRRIAEWCGKGKHTPIPGEVWMFDLDEVEGGR